MKVELLDLLPWLVAAAAMYNSYLNRKKDSRESSALAAAGQESIKSSIIKSQEFTLIQIGVEGLKVSVDALTSCIENKLATKQEFAQMTMRVDAIEAQLQVLQRELRELELEHARCKAMRGTGHD